MRQLFDIVNGAWAACDACLVAVLGRYIVLEFIQKGFDRVRIQAAAALLCYFAGAATWHGMTWWYRGYIDPSIARPIAYSILIGAGVLAAVGALFCIRIFTPRICGPRSWLAATAGAFVLAMISIYLT